MNQERQQKIKKTKKIVLILTPIVLIFAIAGIGTTLFTQSVSGLAGQWQLSQFGQSLNDDYDYLKTFINNDPRNAYYKAHQLQQSFNKVLNGDSSKNWAPLDIHQKKDVSYTTNYQYQLSYNSQQDNDFDLTPLFNQDGFYAKLMYRFYHNNEITSQWIKDEISKSALVQKDYLSKLFALKDGQSYLSNLKLALLKNSPYDKIINQSLSQELAAFYVNLLTKYDANSDALRQSFNQKASTLNLSAPNLNVLNVSAQDVTNWFGSFKHFSFSVPFLAIKRFKINLNGHKLNLSPVDNNLHTDIFNNLANLSFNYQNGQFVALDSNGTIVATLSLTDKSAKSLQGVQWDLKDFQKLLLTSNNTTIPNPDDFKQISFDNLTDTSEEDNDNAGAITDNPINLIVDARGALTFLDKQTFLNNGSKRLTNGQVLNDADVTEEQNLDTLYTNFNNLRDKYRQIGNDAFGKGKFVRNQRSWTIKDADSFAHAFARLMPLLVNNNYVVVNTAIKLDKTNFAKLVFTREHKMIYFAKANLIYDFDASVPERFPFRLDNAYSLPFPTNLEEQNSYSNLKKGVFQGNYDSKTASDFSNELVKAVIVYANKIYRDTFEFKDLKNKDKAQRYYSKITNLINSIATKAQAFNVNGNIYTAIDGSRYLLWPTIVPKSDFFDAKSTLLRQLYNGQETFLPNANSSNHVSYKQTIFNSKRLSKFDNSNHAYLQDTEPYNNNLTATVLRANNVRFVVSQNANANSFGVENLKTVPEITNLINKYNGRIYKPNQVPTSLSKNTNYLTYTIGNWADDTIPQTDNTYFDNSGVQRSLPAGKKVITANITITLHYNERYNNKTQAVLQNDHSRRVVPYFRNSQYVDYLSEKVDINLRVNDKHIPTVPEFLIKNYQNFLTTLRRKPIDALYNWTIVNNNARNQTMRNALKNMLMQYFRNGDLYNVNGLLQKLTEQTTKVAVVPNWSASNSSKTIYKTIPAVYGNRLVERGTGVYKQVKRQKPNFVWKRTKVASGKIWFNWNDNDYFSGDLNNPTISSWQLKNWLKRINESGNGGDSYFEFHLSNDIKSLLGVYDNDVHHLMPLSNLTSFNSWATSYHDSRSGRNFVVNDNNYEISMPLVWRQLWWNLNTYKVADFTVWQKQITVPGEIYYENATDNNGRPIEIKKQVNERYLVSAQRTNSFQAPTVSFNTQNTQDIYYKAPPQYSIVDWIWYFDNYFLSDFRINSLVDANNLNIVGSKLIVDYYSNKYNFNAPDFHSDVPHNNLFKTTNGKYYIISGEPYALGAKQYLAHFNKNTSTISAQDASDDLFGPINDIFAQALANGNDFSPLPNAGNQVQKTPQSLNNLNRGDTIDIFTTVDTDVLANSGVNTFVSQLSNNLKKAFSQNNDDLVTSALDEFLSKQDQSKLVKPNLQNDILSNEFALFLATFKPRFDAFISEFNAGQSNNVSIVVTNSDANVKNQLLKTLGFDNSDSKAVFYFNHKWWQFAKSGQNNTYTLKSLARPLLNLWMPLGFNKTKFIETLSQNQNSLRDIITIINELKSKKPNELNNVNWSQLFFGTDIQNKDQFNQLFTPIVYYLQFDYFQDWDEIVKLNFWVNFFTNIFTSDAIGQSLTNQIPEKWLYFFNQVDNTTINNHLSYHLYNNYGVGSPNRDPLSYASANSKLYRPQFELAYRLTNGKIVDTQQYYSQSYDWLKNHAHALDVNPNWHFSVVNFGFDFNPKAFLLTDQQDYNIARVADTQSVANVIRNGQSYSFYQQQSPLATFVQKPQVGFNNYYLGKWFETSDATFNTLVTPVKKYFLTIDYNNFIQSKLMLQFIYRSLELGDILFSIVKRQGKWQVYIGDSRHSSINLLTDIASVDKAAGKQNRSINDFTITAIASPYNGDKTLNLQMHSNKVFSNAQSATLYNEPLIKQNFASSTNASIDNNIFYNQQRLNYDEIIWLSAPQAPKIQFAPNVVVDSGQSATLIAQDAVKLAAYHNNSGLIQRVNNSLIQMLGAIFNVEQMQNHNRLAINSVAPYWKNAPSWKAAMTKVKSLLGSDIVSLLTRNNLDLVGVIIDALAPLFDDNGNFIDLEQLVYLNSHYAISEVVQTALEYLAQNLATIENINKQVLGNNVASSAPDVALLNQQIIDLKNKYLAANGNIATLKPLIDRALAPFKGNLVFENNRFINRSNKQINNLEMINQSLPYVAAAFNDVSSRYLAQSFLLGFFKWAYWQIYGAPLNNELALTQAQLGNLVPAISNIKHYEYQFNSKATFAAGDGSYIITPVSTWAALQPYIKQTFQNSTRVGQSDNYDFKVYHQQTTYNPAQKRTFDIVSFVDSSTPYDNSSLPTAKFEVDANDKADLFSNFKYNEITKVQAMSKVYTIAALTTKVFDLLSNKDSAIDLTNLWEDDKMRALLSLALGLINKGDDQSRGAKLLISSIIDGIDDYLVANNNFKKMQTNLIEQIKSKYNGKLDGTQVAYDLPDVFTTVDKQQWKVARVGIYKAKSKYRLMAKLLTNQALAAIENKRFDNIFSLIGLARLFYYPYLGQPRNIFALQDDSNASDYFDNDKSRKELFDIDKEARDVLQKELIESVTFAISQKFTIDKMIEELSSSKFDANSFRRQFKNFINLDNNGQIDFLANGALASANIGAMALMARVMGTIGTRVLGATGGPVGIAAAIAGTVAVGATLTAVEYKQKNESWHQLKDLIAKMQKINFNLANGERDFEQWVKQVLKFNEIEIAFENIGKEWNVDKVLGNFGDNLMKTIPFLYTWINSAENAQGNALASIVRYDWQQMVAGLNFYDLLGLNDAQASNQLEVVVQNTYTKQNFSFTLPLTSVVTIAQGGFLNWVELDKFQFPNAAQGGSEAWWRNNNDKTNYVKKTKSYNQLANNKGKFVAIGRLKLYQ